LSEKLYRFRDCYLNSLERGLIKDRKFINLSSKTFDVLQLLIQRAGEVVTKDEFLGKVWDGGFVEEGNLPVQILKIRRSLGETNTERYIETVQGSGYRFVAPVSEMPIELWDGQISPKFHVGSNQLSNSLRPQTQNSESHRLYLKGKHLLKKRNVSDVYRAVKLFQQSAAKDPTHVAAYVELVESFLLLYNMDEISHETVTHKILTPVGIVKDLRPNAARTYVMLGSLAMYVDWAFGDAEIQLKKALELDRFSVFAIFRYMNLLMLSGRFTEALVELQHIIEIDPLSVSTYKRIGRLFYKMGNYESSIAYMQEALELEPYDYESMLLLGASFAEAGDHDKALCSLQRSRDLHETIEGLSTMGYVHARDRNNKKAIEVIELVRSEEKPGFSHAIKLARIYSALGKTDAAFTFLEQAFAYHDVDLIWLSVDPRWSAIASDSRFVDFMERIGLPTKNV
jgi:DNA-binding winged helix-turn-helix (wHTH) protein/Flp pilus assembly protein TadD